MSTHLSAGLPPSFRLQREEGSHIDSFLNPLPLLQLPGPRSPSISPRPNCQPQNPPICHGRAKKKKSRWAIRSRTFIGVLDCSLGPLVLLPVNSQLRDRVGLTVTTGGQRAPLPSHHRSPSPPPWPPPHPPSTPPSQQHQTPQTTTLRPTTTPSPSSKPSPTRPRQSRPLRLAAPETTPPCPRPPSVSHTASPSTQWCRIPPAASR
ncbi:hypothetical protein B0T25DRAFT_361627 [Lasiosphaeria hispida]|uniref:Uncharacterized protein n=1 Tax=Lasiosphaeria hispida TaxID=260671 RepID=A0AAJ0H527_9PEZI|nr:hypothetical protein B0T25DRAFT_361627 [Lasiosphaeria hispida]